MAARKRAQEKPKTGRATWREGWTKREGVKLVAPQGRSGWRVRWKDPDSPRDNPRWKSKTIPAEHARSAEARQAYAERQAKKVRDRATDLERGAPRKTGSQLEAVIERYYHDHPRLRRTTVEAYRGATDKLLAWAQKKNLKSADDLGLPELKSWRATLIRERKTVAVKGGKRGERRQTKEPRSPSAVGRELRAARTVLGYLVDLDLFPMLTHDKLRRGLKREKMTVERLEYLRREEIATLLDVCLEYDAMRADLRARELANIEREGGGREARPMEPVAPFVMALLLGGFRLSEALNLQWSDVDLDALDDNGEVSGEIHLKGSKVKTHKARDVGLGVSPTLRELLGVLREQSDGKGRVFALQRPAAVSAAKRLRADRGAPESFSYQALRRTCGTYLACATEMGSQPRLVADRMGHSMAVGETRYYSAMKGARPMPTLEAAMQIEGHVERVIDAARARVV